MSLTSQQAALDCLEHIGEFSLTFTDHVGNTALSVRRALVRAQNQALEELFGLNPRLFKRTVGATILAPQTGTVGVTTDSTAATPVSFTSPLHGNTIRIAGHDNYNQIRTEGSDKKLLLPYTGPTGTQAATLYGDCLLLDAAYSKPLGPVWLSDIGQLSEVVDKQQLLAYGYDQSFLNTDWNFHPGGMSRSVQPRTISQPEVYFVESHTEGGTTIVRLIFGPLPDRAYSLAFDAGVRPLPVTDADIGTDENNDPNRLFALPDAKDNEYLLPLILYHWTKSAHFSNADKAKGLVDAYLAALPKIKAYGVAPCTDVRFHISGWR